MNMISECLLVYVLAFSCRSFACHDLGDKPLFVLQCLIAVRIERTFGNIAENLHVLVFVTLTDNSTGALFQTSRSVE